MSTRQGLLFIVAHFSRLRARTLAAVALKTREKRQPAKGSLVENAYAALKSAILDNSFPPGYQSAEVDVAAQLGMSRTPVHEAVIRLQEEGLVELLPRKGVRIRAISPSDIRDIYQLIVAVEGMAAEVLASQPASAAKAKITKRLESETQTMEVSLERDDLDAWAAADDHFHQIMTDNCGNSRLARIAAALRDQTHRTRLLTLRLRPIPKKSAVEHYAIIDEIKKGNAGAAAKCASGHRRRASQIMIPLLERFVASGL